MSDDFNYYNFLHVAPNAPLNEIKAAYRAGVLKYHPDINKSKEAESIIIMLNESYNTLSDPQKRINYDTYLKSGSMEEEPPEEILEIYVCDRCNKFHPHLRVVTFYKVWSAIFFTRSIPSVNILCPDCRNTCAKESALFSALLGPWGFPWGVIFTIRALFTVINGGNFSKKENSKFLMHQGLALLQQRHIDESLTYLTSSLSFKKNQEINNILKDDIFNGSKIIDNPKMLKIQSAGLITIGIIISIFFVLFIIGSLFPTSETSNVNRSSSSTSTQQATVAANGEITYEDRMNKEKSLWTTCDKGTWTQDIYNSCVSLDKMYQQDINDDKNNIRNQQIDEYNDTLVKISEISMNGAAQLGSSVTDNISNTLKDLMKNGADSGIKDHAEHTYDCYFDGVCQK